MSPALHYWMGGAHHCSGLPVSEMTYTVSSGTLNSTIPYHTSRTALKRCTNTGIFWNRKLAPLTLTEFREILPLRLFRSWPADDWKLQGQNWFADITALRVRLHWYEYFSYREAVTLPLHLPRGRLHVVIWFNVCHLSLWLLLQQPAW